MEVDSSKRTTLPPSSSRQDRLAARNTVMSATPFIESLVNGETRPLLVNESLSEPDSRVIKKKFISKNTLRNTATAVFLWLGYLFLSALYSLLAPFFPIEAAAKGAPPVVVGIIMAVAPLCVVIFSPIFGFFLPKLGLKFTLLCGVFIDGGTFILFAFVSSPQISSGWMFIFFCVLLRVVEGVGSSMYFTATFAFLPELFPNHVSTIMGIFEVGSGLGYSLGPPLGGILYEAGGFKLPFLVVGGVTLFFIVPIFILMKSPECKPQVFSWKMVLALARNFKFVLLVITNILCLASIAFVTPTLEPFLKLHFPYLSPAHIGLVFLSGPFAYMLASIAIGPLSDKLGPEKFVVSGTFVFGLSYFFIGPADIISTPQLWMTVVAFIVVGIGISLGVVPVYALMLAIVKDVAPADIDSAVLNGILSGVVSSSLSFGEFVGPLISGGLAHHFDFQTSCVLFGEVILAEGSLLFGVTVIDSLLSRTK